MVGKSTVQLASIISFVCFVVVLNASDSKSEKTVVTFHARPLTAKQKLEYEQKELLSLLALRRQMVVCDEQQRLENIQQFSHKDWVEKLLRYWDKDTQLSQDLKRAYKIPLPTFGKKIIATVLFKNPQLNETLIAGKGYIISNFWGKDADLRFSVYSSRQDFPRGPVIFGLGLCPGESHCLHDTEANILSSIAPTRKNSLADQETDEKKS